MKKKIIRIAITGAYGRMGSHLIKNIKKFNNIVLKLLIINNTDQKIINNNNIIISNEIEKHMNQFDVLIDFSTPQSSLRYLKICHKNNKNIVIGTTGFKKKELYQIKKYSNDIGIILSSNFSMGINIIAQILKSSAQLFDDSYDIEILEEHHNKKLDSPSGTALTLGKIIAKNKKWDFNSCQEYRKNQLNQARQKKKIGFSIIRGGNIVGNHKIMFINSGEKITISHQAYNRDTFSIGAIKSAIWLIKKKSGLFNMMDVINDIELDHKNNDES
ncbi:4-hydroxy-tetrahydrodipicolinate reductase [Buchnera aphidicola]|uniref:4-hydroxy-tetrahydrodipicolinate reductase n=1 Tax=Buchnera aphidicola TaxID=9 RepID=UPI00346429B0